MNEFSESSERTTVARPQPVHDIDRDVWLWMKRVYLVVFLALGIVAVAVIVVAASRPGAMQKEIAKLAQSPTAESETCYVCDKSAVGYWYPVARPDYRVHVCSMHMHNSSARVTAEWVVTWPRLLLMVALVAFVAPYMMYKYWPRFPPVSEAIDSSAAASTTTWFWVLVSTSAIFHAVALPVNLFIALKARAAYRLCPKRRRLCTVAVAIAAWPLGIFACLLIIRVVFGFGS